VKLCCSITINHDVRKKIVMLVEIPDPEVILGIVIAFLAGLLSLLIFYKIKPLIKNNERSDSSNFERLEFYERQLIDMKIRLDSLAMEGESTKSVRYDDLEEFEDKIPKQGRSLMHGPPRRQQQMPRTSGNNYNNTFDYVLGLITDKEMTSRDIQIASQRSREHTSRLMNKLFKDGYVERNTKTKPYSYSITAKGRAKLSKPGFLQEVTA